MSAPDDTRPVVSESEPSSAPWILGAVALIVLLVVALIVFGGGSDGAGPGEEVSLGVDSDRAGGLAPSERLGDAEVGDPQGPDPTAAVTVTAPPSGPVEVTLTVPEAPGHLILVGPGPAVDAFVAAVGQPFQARELVIYDTYAFMEFRDPDVPDHVDEYTYRDGVIEGPEPVSLSSIDDVAAEVFSLADVNFDALPELADLALREFGLDNGEVTHVIIDRFLPWDANVNIRVYVSDPDRGGGGYLRAAADGTPIEAVG